MRLLRTFRRHSSGSFAFSFSELVPVFVEAVAPSASLGSRRISLKPTYKRHYTAYLRMCVTFDLNFGALILAATKFSVFSPIANFAKFSRALKLVVLQ